MLKQLHWLKESRSKRSTCRLSGRQSRAGHTAHTAHLVCCRKREKRKMEESLRKVKTLGQADKEVDDLAKWVTKSRTREEEDKELAREEALNAQRRQAEQVCLPTCWRST